MRFPKILYVKMEKDRKPYPIGSANFEDICETVPVRFGIYELRETTMAQLQVKTYGTIKKKR